MILTATTTATSVMGLCTSIATAVVCVLARAGDIDHKHPRPISMPMTIATADAMVERCDCNQGLSLVSTADVSPMTAV